MLLPALAAVTILAAADDNVEWNGVSHVAFQDRRPLCPVDGESFEVRFQTWRDDLTAARVQVDDGATAFVTASVDGQRGPYDVWSAQIPATAAATLSYWIELTDGTDTDYYSVAGMSDGPPDDGGFALDWATLDHAPLGATPLPGGGAVFKVWAPNATQAHVRGTFNNWLTTNTLTKVGDHWIRRIANAAAGQEYKYFFNNTLWKEDPRARAMNAMENYNAVIEDRFQYAWTVEDFATPPLEELVIYQLHPGTFPGRNDPAGTPPFPGGYLDVADRVAHLVELGVNAVMLNPITEFPGDESAGYNPITQWSPEWVYGDPDELKAMIDVLHQNDIAVLLDNVWNHFSTTDNFLWFYDGTQIYFDSPAVSTPWGDQADFDSPDVRSYFLDSALHWLEEYKVDGFRMDGTDFMNMGSHAASGWSLMQALNDMVDNRFANKVIIAEQLPDDDWVTRPTSAGGAGFDSQYFDAFTDRLREEIFDAAFGDPEMFKIRDVINGFGPDLSKQKVVNYVELHDEAWPTSGGQRLVKTIDPTFPHDDVWARGRSRLAQGLVLTAPGVPALLMGGEWLEDTDFGTAIGNRIDWSKKTTYASTFDYVSELVTLRASQPGLRADAFHFVYHVNEGGNVIGFQRTDFAGNDWVAIANFSNTTYNGYRIGVPVGGDWAEVVNSQSPAYGEGGPDNPGPLSSQGIAADGFLQSVQLEIPAMAFVLLRWTPAGVDAPAVAGAPGGLSLEAPVPNPAAGERTIAFGLAREADVRLEIVDLAGRRVAEVVAGERAAGRHTAAWDGRDEAGRRVAAGVYFVRLEAAGETLTRKLTVLR